MPLAHGFVSGVADGSTTTDVRPSNWNADHVGTTLTSASIPEVLYRAAPTSNSNTTAQLTLMNYSIPARSLGTGKMLRATLCGMARRGSTVTAPTWSMELLHGGSSRWRDVAVTDLGLTADPVQVFAEFYIGALNSSGTRYAKGFVVYSSQTTATFGAGDVAGIAGVRSLNVVGSSATFSITTGAAEVFQVRFNWVNANTSRTFNFDYGALELV